VICPACGARNSATADWCSLCYTPLRTEPPVAEAPVAEAPVPEPSAAAPRAGRPSVAEPASDGARTTSSDGRFRRTDEGLDWRCAACETWNPIERQSCSSCRAPFTRTIAPEVGQPPAPEVSESAVVGASLVLPGAGHLLLGRTGAGALRMILYVTWLVGGILLLRAAAGSGQPVLPAVPLLIGALIVLVASVVEAQRGATGDDTVLLQPRVTLWLVVAVLGALMLSFLAATLSVGR
jgi:hypothetical protein